MEKCCLPINRPGALYCVVDMFGHFLGHPHICVSMYIDIYNIIQYNKMYNTTRAQVKGWVSKRNFITSLGN